jgi:predicted metal-dependent hydrolase
MILHQISISDISIDVIRKNIKNLHLSVYPPTGRVRVAAPLSIDDETIRLFAISKLGWIKRHQRNFAAQDRQSPRQYLDRESHYFEGKRYLLRVTERDAPPKVDLKTTTHIDLGVRPNTTTEQCQNILNAWYRAQLKLKVPTFIEKWEKKLNVQLNDWGIKQMKTKWGTCNIEDKRIWINLELAKKPVHCLEYIVVHEMMHLLERYHNDRFQLLMDKHLPHWKFYKDELNRLPVNHGEWSY